MCLLLPRVHKINLPPILLYCCNIVVLVVVIVVVIIMLYKSVEVFIIAVVCFFFCVFSFYTKCMWVAEVSATRVSFQSAEGKKYMKIEKQFHIDHVARMLINKKKKKNMKGIKETQQNETQINLQTNNSHKFLVSSSLLIFIVICFCINLPRKKVCSHFTTPPLITKCPDPYGSMFFFYFIIQNVL